MDRRIQLVVSTHKAFRQMYPAPTSVQRQRCIIYSGMEGAYFWPLLTNDGVFFLPFVKDFLLMDPYFVSNCNDRSVFSGSAKFRSHALLLDFSE